MSFSRKILLINPNSSRAMTACLEEMLAAWKEHETNGAIQIVTYTAPSGPASINDKNDGDESAVIVMNDLQSTLGSYDAFLVACYSAHPLVPMLQGQVGPHVHVTGIFEASITTALSLYDWRYKFGIISTGVYWKDALSEAIMEFLDVESFKRFKGVETTGLDAGELHSASPELVRTKIMEATKRLVRFYDVRVICLGCAGMSGLDDIVYEALVEALGQKEADRVHIVDGVKAGIVLLEGLLKVLPGRRI